jgi:hypothetical protein
VRGAAARCGRWWPTAAPPALPQSTLPPPPGPTERRIDRQRQAEQHTDRRQAGAVAERRVAEALRSRAIDPDRERDWQGEEPDREPEDLGDSWRAYRERADHIRQTYGWTVPQPPRATNWLPLGHGDDQEYDQPPDRSRKWSGEDRDARHDER